MSVVQPSAVSESVSKSVAALCVFPPHVTMTAPDPFQIFIRPPEYNLQLLFLQLITECSVSFKTLKRSYGLRLYFCVVLITTFSCFPSVPILQKCHSGLALCFVVTLCCKVPSTRRSTQFSVMLMWAGFIRGPHSPRAPPRLLHCHCSSTFSLFTFHQESSQRHVHR